MLIMFFKHTLSLSICLRCFHVSLLGLGVDEILKQTMKTRKVQEESDEEDKEEKGFGKDLK